MNHCTYQVYNTIHSVDDEWDRLAGNNRFLKKSALNILEKTNPCGQQYHMFYFGRLNSIVVTYILNLNIFTYLKGSFSIPVMVIGIPCSVSRCGYVIGQDTSFAVYEYLNGIKGGALILNAFDKLELQNLAMGSTLPVYTLNILWDTFDDYLLSLRSNYRYRIRKALIKRGSLDIIELKNNDEFNESHYALYLETYNHSRFKLEQLPLDFFRKFPSKIIIFNLNNTPVGFVQLAINDKELIFMFGGMRYDVNTTCDLYMNMLLEIIRIGIELGNQMIDMGQTAGHTKMYLGCTQSGRAMYAGHSNPLIRFSLHRLMKCFSYKSEEQNYHVFKGEQQ